MALRRDADAPSRHAFSIFFCIAARRSSQLRIQSSADAALSAAPRARNDDEKSERTRSERIESKDAAIELRACSMDSARAVEAIEAEEGPAGVNVNLRSCRELHRAFDAQPV